MKRHPKSSLYHRFLHLSPWKHREKGMNPTPKRQKRDSDASESELREKNDQQLSNTVVHRPIPIYPTQFNLLSQSMTYPNSSISFPNANIVNQLNGGQMLYSNGVISAPCTNSVLPCNPLVTGQLQTVFYNRGFDPSMNLVTTNMQPHSHPVFFSNAHEANVSSNKWTTTSSLANNNDSSNNSISFQQFLELAMNYKFDQSQYLVARKERKRITRKKDYTLLLPNELIVKIFDSFCCSSEESFDFLVVLSHVNRRWRRIIANPLNYPLMKTLRIEVSEIIFAQSGADYIFKIEEVKYLELTHIWTPDEDWILENVDDKWTELVRESPVTNAPLPRGFERDLWWKFARFEPVAISFKNISIGKPLLRLLSQILSKYDRHNHIFFSEKNETSLLHGVTFDDDVEPADLSSVYRNFMYVNCIPPIYWDARAFDKWVTAERKSDFLYVEDSPVFEGFEIRNGEIENFPISLKNFSRVGFFMSTYAETSINEIIEAAKTRMIEHEEVDGEEKDEQLTHWHMAIADMHIEDVCELIMEAGKRHKVEISTPVVRQRETGQQFVDAQLTINNMTAHIIYGRFSKTVEITTTPPEW